MKRLAVVALPLAIVGLALLVVLVLARRRRNATPAQAEDASAEPSAVADDPHRPPMASGIDVLRGYDERHEEEEEAKHGAVLRVSTDRISVRQV
jgi:hypothetical protein